MCAIMDRCTRGSKIEFWEQTKRCENDGCRDWVRSKWRSDRKHCNLTCQQWVLQDCGRWADAKDDPDALAEWADCTALGLREMRMC